MARARRAGGARKKAAKKEGPPRRVCRVVCHGTTWQQGTCARCGREIGVMKRVWALIDETGMSKRWKDGGKGSVCDECAVELAKEEGAELEKLSSIVEGNKK